MALSRNKELRIFEALENITNNESFDSTTSFIRKFVNCDLDLNNTHQSIPEEADFTLQSDDERNSCSSSEIESEESAPGGDGGQIPNHPKEDNEDIDDESVRSQSPDDVTEVLKILREKYDTEYMLLSEMKYSLDVQESQLEHEKSEFVEQKHSEQKKLNVEKRNLETQRKKLHSLMVDYQKIKNSKEECDEQIKELSVKLKDTKLEMGKRISRWADQQRKLEERVKALEKENKELKKQKPIHQRVTALKRPPMWPPQKNAANFSKQTKRIHFADDVDSQENKPKSNSNVLKQVNTKNEISKAETSFESNKMSTNNKTYDGKEYFENNHPVDVDQLSKRDHLPREVRIGDEDADKTMPSDYIEVTHPCGTITRVTTDNTMTRHIMVNKDVMEKFEDCSVRYYYHNMGFAQTTYPNGDEIVEYDSGVLETRRADGSKIVTFVDGIVKIVDSSGTEEVYFVDGSVMKKDHNGESTVFWPSGQKEIRTSTYVKRVYTNGTTKTKYADGSEETCYWTGRVRRKDKYGVLIDDTKAKPKTNSCMK